MGGALLSFILALLAASGPLYAQGDDHDHPHNTQRTPQEAQQMFQERFSEYRQYMSPSQAWDIRQAMYSRPPKLTNEFFQEYANALDTIDQMRKARAQGLTERAEALEKHMRVHFRNAAETGGVASQVVGTMREAWLESRAAGGGSSSGGGRPDSTDADVARDAARQFPNDGGIQQAAGDVLRQAGDLGAAREAYDRAVALEPENPKAYSGRAQLSYDQKDYAAAAEDARSALTLDPRDMQALTVYQLTKGRAGPAAAGAFRPFAPAGGTSPLDRRAAAKNAAAVEARRHLEDASSKLGLKDYERAVEAARKAAGLAPESLDARRIEIGALLRWGRYKDALAAADRALKAFPKNPWLLTARAKSLNMLRRHGEALASADRAARLDPRNAEALLNRAWALDGLGGRRGEALESLRKAASLNPQYRVYLDRYLSEGDLAALLAGERPPEGLAAKDSGWRLPRVLGMSLATLVGGLLVAVGLLKWGTSSLGTKVRRSLGRLSARSPAVGEMPARNGTPVPRPGDTPLNVGAYRLVRQIGTGGMGVVYEGLDRSLDRRVAVKKMREEIRSDPRERHRFLSEARTVAALRHPNIVEIFSVVEEAQDAYLVFEYVDGRTLSAVLKDRRRMDFGEAVETMRGVCSALDYAHAKGVVHRDLKPSNIMVDAERCVKVMDFGVARQAKDSLSRLSMTSTVVGTPPYMAPEQEQGVVRRNSDVYALGVCVYEMVTGRLPFNGLGAGMLMVKLNKTYTPASHAVPNLPAGLDAVLDRALEPDPDKRTPSAGEFLKELEALLYSPRA